MRIEATRKTAVLSGFFLVFAISSLGALVENTPKLQIISEYSFFIAAVLFFALTIPFVIGAEIFHSKLWNPLTREYWDLVRPVILRLLFFFLGAATFGMAYAYVLNELIK